MNQLCSDVVAQETFVNRYIPLSCFHLNIVKPSTHILELFPFPFLFWHPIYSGYLNDHLVIMELVIHKKSPHWQRISFWKSFFFFPPPSLVIWILFFPRVHWLLFRFVWCLPLLSIESVIFIPLRFCFNISQCSSLHPLFPSNKSFANLMPLFSSTGKLPS